MDIWFIESHVYTLRGWLVHSSLIHTWWEIGLSLVTNIDSLYKSRIQKRWMVGSSRVACIYSGAGLISESHIYRQGEGGWFIISHVLRREGWVVFSIEV